jgi:hypothetical protein
MLRRTVLPPSSWLKFVVKNSGIQPGVRVPPGVRDDILGGT